VKDTSERANAKTAEARMAAVELRAVETARAVAEARLAAVVRALEAAKTTQTREPAEGAKATAEAQLREAIQKVDETKRAAALKAGEAADAERAWKAARAAQGAAQTTAKEAARRISPVSILVSKKNMRVYVRQGLAPVLEAPVVISDPDVPLGTHLYIAVASQNDGSSLGWSVVSLPSSPASPESRPARRGREPDRNGKTVLTERMLQASSPAQALERIEIPQEVKARKLVDFRMRLVDADLLDGQDRIEQTIELGAFDHGVEHLRRTVREDRGLQSCALEGCQDARHLGKGIDSQIERHQSIA
jgi:hypothetical protein